MEEQILRHADKVSLELALKLSLEDSQTVSVFSPFDMQIYD